MADQKLSALTELATTPANDDEIYIRDVSEIAANESKRITIANLLAGAATIVRKTADETVNNSEVLQNDDHLLFPVAANEIWEFVLSLRVTSPSADPDIDWLFAIPAGASLLKWEIPSLTPTLEKDGTVEAVIPVAAGILEYWECHYVYIGGGNAGNVQMQWAQRIATVEDTKVLENSFIIAHKLG